MSAQPEKIKVYYVRRKVNPEPKFEPVLSDGTEPSTSGRIHMEHDDYDYQTLRNKYDELLESNRLLTEKNQLLSDELFAWEAMASDKNKGVKELVKNEDLRGVSVKFLVKSAEWKNRCEVAERRCAKLSVELDTLKANSSYHPNSEQNSLIDNSQSIKYFEQMERWKDRFQRAEKDVKMLTLKLNTAKSQEVLLRNALKVGNDTMEVAERREEYSRRKGIFLDNDVDLWKNYTYDLRRDLESEQLAHKRTKELLRQAKEGDSGPNEETLSVEVKEEENNDSTSEPPLKIPKIEIEDDYNHLDPSAGSSPS